METACVYEQKTVIHELTQGMQMAKQLRVNLDSPEARDFFIHKILSSYDKALLVLKSAGQPREVAPEPSMSTESPRSGEFDFDQKVVSKKRKTSGTWTKQVRINTNDGLEGNIDDGYGWRKYGQKDILGTRFPRCYYRCTHRNTQNCLATKQVQRTDEHPTTLQITYKRKHTCNHAAQSAPPPPLLPEKHETKQIHHHQPTPSLEKHETKKTHHHHHQPPLPQPNSGEVLSNLKANLRVNTSDLFSFPSTPFGFIEDEKDLHFQNLFDDELLQGYSPSFISLATSESNYLTEWGNSSSLDFPADLDPDFEFNNSIF